MHRRAKEIRVRSQQERWSCDRIVDEILRQLPDMLPLEAHRHAQGWTRPQVTHGIDELYRADGLMPPQLRSSEICRWEHGRHMPNAERQDYLARLYRTRPDRLGFGRDYGGSESAPEDQAATLIVQMEGDMERRTVIKLLGGFAVAGSVPSQVDVERLVAAVSRPRPVDPEVVAGLRAMSTSFATLPATVAPGPVLQPALALLAHVEGMLRESAPDGVRRELGFVVGEAALVAGRLYRNLGRQDEARAHYVHAKQLSAEMEDPVLAAYARICESELHSQLAIASSPKETAVALRLLEEAASLPALPATMRTKIAAAQSEELATLGRGADSAAALERAHRFLAEVRDEERVGFFSAWTMERLGAFEGTCRLLLGEPRAAVLPLERSIRAIDPSHAGIRLALRIDLGAAYAHMGETAEGGRILGEAFGEAEAMGHAHLMRRARRARARLAGAKPELAVLSA